MKLILSCKYIYVYSIKILYLFASSSFLMLLSVSFGIRRYFPMPGKATDFLLVLLLQSRCKLLNKGAWHRTGQSNKAIVKHYVTLQASKPNILKIVEKCKKFPKLKINFNATVSKTILSKDVGSDYFRLMEAVGLVGKSVGPVVTADDYEQPRRATRHSAKFSNSPVNLLGDDPASREDDPKANEVFAVYPTQEDAVGAVTLRKGHLFRLEPGVYLNDELVDFKIRHLLEESFPEAKFRFHIYNSHFYIKLRDNGYSEVSKWAKNVDLFKKDFLIVPINQADHWSLVVIARPGLVAGLDPNHKESVKASPKIISKGKKRSSSGSNIAIDNSNSSSSSSSRTKRLSSSSSSSSSSSTWKVPLPPDDNKDGDEMDIVVDNSSQATIEQVEMDISDGHGDGEELNINISPHSDSDAEKPSEDEERDMPCFICMDSLQMHRMGVICKNLRS